MTFSGAVAEYHDNQRHHRQLSTNRQNSPSIDIVPAFTQALRTLEDNIGQRGFYRDVELWPPDTTARSYSRSARDSISALIVNRCRHSTGMASTP